MNTIAISPQYGWVPTIHPGDVVTKLALQGAIATAKSVWTYYRHRRDCGVILELLEDGTVSVIEIYSNRFRLGLQGVNFDRLGNRLRRFVSNHIIKQGELMFYNYCCWHGFHEGKGHGSCLCQSDLRNASGSFADEDTTNKHQFLWYPLDAETVFRATGPKTHLNCDDLERIYKSIVVDGKLESIRRKLLGKDSGYDRWLL